MWVWTNWKYLMKWNKNARTPANAYSSLVLYLSTYMIAPATSSNDEKKNCVRCLQTVIALWIRTVNNWKCEMSTRKWLLSPITVKQFVNWLKSLLFCYVFFFKLFLSLCWFADLGFLYDCVEFSAKRIRSAVDADWKQYVVGRQFCKLIACSVHCAHFMCLVLSVLSSLSSPSLVVHLYSLQHI